MPMAIAKIDTASAIQYSPIKQMFVLIRDWVPYDYGHPRILAWDHQLAEKSTVLAAHLILRIFCVDRYY
jgi:hypothetical protein